MTQVFCATALAVQMTANMVSGVISQGVNCPMIEGDDGEYYAVSSLPDAVRMGDRVLVEIDPDAPPFFGVCDQGKHIQWVRMTRPAVAGQPEMTWKNDEY
ncbi:MAG: hypothetical protein AB3N17_12495 [Tateyamaria sp.]